MSSSSSLGCGSLILIALVVAMFSGSNRISDVGNRMQSDVRRLERKITQLSDQVERLTALIEQRSGAGTEPVKKNGK